MKDSFRIAQMNRGFLWILLSAIIWGVQPSIADEIEVRKAPKRVAKNWKHTQSDYLYYAPARSEKGEPKPLLIFLHGSGQRGTHINQLKTLIPPFRWFITQEAVPFVIVAPQCKPNAFWNPDELDEWLDHLIEEGGFDRDRIYLTGLSMGGYGTIHWAAHRAKTFKAIAPVCGGWFRSERVDKPSMKKRKTLASHPIWLFHGELDRVVLSSESKRVRDWVKAVGNKEVKCTIYPHLGHNCWDAAYLNSTLYDWLLSYE
jgi:predicted peptidase